MGSAKGKIVRLFSRFGLARAKVHAVHRVGAFRRLELAWEAKPFAAGAKVQMLLPSDDVRTYTPIPSAIGMDLLGWRHGDGPGARWLDAVRVGDELPFVGPQRSLSVEPGQIVVVGDETSVALAAAFTRERPGRAHTVIQSDAANDVRAAAESVGLTDVDVVPRDDSAATVDAIRERLLRAPGATVALTGGSELIVAVRDALRRVDLPDVKTKAHWIPGRTGLD